MLESIQSLLPGVTIYLIPLVPLVIMLWWMQHRANKTMARFSEVETNYIAKETAKKMLQEKSVTTPIERSDDYSQNAYDPRENKIFLGPDTYDQKDVTALGLAARAAGKAIFTKTSPEMAKVLDTMKRVTQVFFWLVFTVLAFGFMGNSALTVLIGYGLLALMLLSFFFDMKKEADINRSIIDQLSRILSDDVLTKVKKILQADIRRF